MSHVCQRCNKPKSAAEMVVRAGKPSKTCAECFREAMAERGGRKRKSVDTVAPKPRKSRSDEQTPAPEPVTIIGPALEMAPGFGFRASVEDERLSVEQDDSEGKTDNVVLSRTELRVLIAEFASWAGLNVVTA